MQVLSLKVSEKATSCTQSSASSSQRPGSAKPSSAKQENPLLSGLGGNPERVSRVCKEKSLAFHVFNVLVGSISRTGKRPGTITNPECTLDAIFTLLTPGLH